MRGCGVLDQLSILVVAADSGRALERCVQSVLACTTPLELILVDNGSGDGIPQALEQHYRHDPRCHVLYNRANLGFGPAMNRGAALAKGANLLILNPDCLLRQDHLERLLDIVTNEKDVGLIGVVICHENGEPDPASYRRDPTLSRICNSLRDSARGGVHMQGSIPARLLDTEAVSGALMLLPRPVWDRLQGFDEGYFLHFEDLDLCRRVRDLGYRVLLAGDLRVTHLKGESSRHRPVFVSRYKHRGMWRWFDKFDPQARSWPVRILVWFGIWSHFALTAPMLYLRRRRA